MQIWTTTGAAARRRTRCRRSRQRKLRDYVSRNLAQLAAAPDFDETIRKMWAHEQREHSTIRETALDFEGYAAAAAAGSTTMVSRRSSGSTRIPGGRTNG
jgi:hypothetical protein